MKAKEVVDEVTAKVQKTANVKVVFGDPIEKDTLTIIPVATTKVSGGGGGGVDDAKKSGGMGLGLNVTTTPIGYIKIEGGSATFVDIIDKSKLAAGGMVVGALSLVLLISSVGRVRRHAH